MSAVNKKKGENERDKGTSGEEGMEGRKRRWRNEREVGGLEGENK